MFAAKAHNPLLAAMLIAVASAFIASTTLLAKALGTDVLGPALHPMQISHGRFLFAFLVIISVVGIRHPRLNRPNWGLHIGRASFGWLGVTLMFASVAFIPIADATAISFLNPVFAMVLAIPLLKEGVGPWRWLAAAMALTGALVLLRPTPASFQSAGLLALAAAAVIGMELIFIRLSLQIVWADVRFKFDHGLQAVSGMAGIEQLQRQQAEAVFPGASSFAGCR